MPTEAVIVTCESCGRILAGVRATSQDGSVLLTEGFSENDGRITCNACLWDSEDEEAGNGKAQA